MRRSHLTLAALLVVTAASANVATAQGRGQSGQRPAPQQPRPAQTPRTQQQGQQGQQQGQSQQQVQERQHMHQQMMVQMQETMQRMTQLRERARRLSDGVRAQVHNRERATEQQRLMLQTSEALSASAREMHGLAERTQEMIRSRDFQRDQTMQRDMDRLRQHLNTMATELDGSLQIMEQLRTRTVASQ